MNTWQCVAMVNVHYNMLTLITQPASFMGKHHTGRNLSTDTVRVLYRGNFANILTQQKIKHLKHNKQPSQTNNAMSARCYLSQVQYVVSIFFLLFHNDKVSTNECYQAEYLHVLASSCLWGWVLQSINLMQHFWLLLVGANMLLSWELTNSAFNFKTVRQEIQRMWQRTEILPVTGSKISCVV